MKKFSNVNIDISSSSRGFSLFEVLISLLLVTSISLALLKQQWESNLFFVSAIHHINRLIDVDNQHELNPHFTESP